jgi:acid-sensing ion channel, other
MPYEVPQLKTSYFDLHLKHSLTSVVKPKMMTTSDELRDYSVSERKCYFSNERRLQYFNQYTQSNCEIECIAEFINQKCKCLPVNFNS